MTDNLHYLLYLVGGLGIGFFALPVVLRARVTLRPDSSVYSEVDCGVLAGALGARIQIDGGSTRISPAIFHLILPWPKMTKGSTSGLEIEKPTQVEEALEGDPPPRPDAPDKEQTGVGLQSFQLRMRTLVGRISQIFSIAAKPALRLTKALPGAVRIRHLALSGRFGFEDPAQTGQICGLLWPLSAALPGRIRVDVRPDFTASSTSGSAKFVVHVHLGYILLLCLKFGFAVGRRWIWTQLRRLPARIREYLASRRANALPSAASAA